MPKFEMEAPIVMDTKEDIANALRDIADKIEEGYERDFIPGEVQCMEWCVGDDDFDEDDEYEDGNQNFDEYGEEE